MVKKKSKSHSNNKNNKNSNNNNNNKSKSNKSGSSITREDKLNLRRNHVAEQIASLKRVGGLRCQISVQL